MDTVISDLVSRYERGSLTRRQLVQGLALLAGASAAVPASAAAPFQTTSLDHVSLQVKDLDKSANFYKSVFGLPVINEDPKTKTVRLKVGGGRIAIRQIEPSGVIDHIAFGVAHFDKPAVIAALKQQGVTPLETGEPLQFHVVDPDGYPVQIISTENR